MDVSAPCEEACRAAGGEHRTRFGAFETFGGFERF